MEIFGYDLLTIAVAGAAWLSISYLFWVFVARPMFKKWTKSTIINMLKDPDGEVVSAINDLTNVMLPTIWNWFLTAEIKTGKIIENEDGTKTEETTTPYASLINSTATILFKKFSGMKGGAMKGANALLGQIEGGDGAPLLSFLAPQKGEDPTLWMLKQKLAPIIGDIIEKKLNSALGNITQGGAEGW